MLVFDSPATMTAWSASQQLAGHRVGLVPTMGALHHGHVALIGEAQRSCDVVVVSIFVNPLQFNRRDDFDRYPRPGQGDLDVCVANGVDAVYAPTAEAMYPPGFDTHVEIGRLAETLEGAGRPGHFRGVATVVAKLFNAVRPHIAVFGEKDFQQLAVINQMVNDLDMAITIVAVRTEREADGLAMSSRNQRLTSLQRDAAVVVPAAIEAVKAAFVGGNCNAHELCQIATNVVSIEPFARLEYVDLVDPHTLQHINTVNDSTRVIIAVWFDDIRLIDNAALSD